MNLLLAIQSCHRDRIGDRHWGPGQTYLLEWGNLIAHRFVLGDPTDPNYAPNLLTFELHAPVPDDYSYCVWKTKAACEFALRMKIDYLFHCCNDTYVAIPRLLEVDLTQGHDYIGHRCDEGHASGGCGYWLSARAMKCIAAQTPEPIIYEDLWVGKTLRANGIELHHDPRYADGQPDKWGPDRITAHLSRGTDVYDVAWMRAAHASYVDQLMKEAGLCLE